MSEKKHKFLLPNELLRQEQVDCMSRSAVRLYCYVANYLLRRQVSAFWDSDVAMSRSALIPEHELRAAQSELKRAGLLHVTPGKVQTLQTRYELFAEFGTGEQ